MKSAWKKFIEKGEIDDKVSQFIANSWKRSREFGLNPYKGNSRIILDNNSFKEKLQMLEPLINIALPFMTSLYSIVEGSGFMVVLSDNEGYLLKAIGDNKVLSYAQSKGFIEGVNWSEKFVGTNALGLSLLTGRPVQVCSFQHYCSGHHEWTCSSSPIKDAKGQIVGVLNVSGNYKLAHSHTLGMVLAAANAIENQLKAQEIMKELFSANKYTNTVLDSISEGVISVDVDGVITRMNTCGMKMLEGNLIGKNIDILPVLYSKINDVLNNSNGVTDHEVVVDIKSTNKQFSVTTRPIQNHNGIIAGVVLTLKEMKLVHRLINRLSGSQANFTFDDIIGNCEELTDIINILKKSANNRSSILIQGESGTGKEMFAQAVHNFCYRRSGPFVAINCAAIPRDLIESELFGYEEGAFTGAKKGGRPGKFELANGGTIFLDEIGDMPLEVQATLLRVLQERKVIRVGGSREIPLDIRVMASTNKFLFDEVQKNNFRLDLYYRINVINVTVPPLRYRGKDIITLANNFLIKFCLQADKSNINLSPGATKILCQYSWPGNVRELQNVMERVVSMVDDKEIKAAYIEKVIMTKKKLLNESINNLNAYECEYIKQVLESNKDNIAKSALMLGIGRNTLYRKIRKCGIYRR